MKDVVIVGALRTPIGCFQGALSRHSAVELGSVVVKALVEKTGIDPHSVDEVILGQVLTAGTGQNPARQSAIRGGLPNTVSAITINDVCGSGLKALHLATQAIQCGEADVVIAGGQENMSRAPHVLTDSRTGAQLGNSQLIDSLVHDGLWDAFNDYHMGVTAENLARAAEANGATLIHVSTDYVFDGTAHLPYTEDAPTAPLGVYGRTKLAGERAVAESGCKYLTFRTAWLYSEYGNNFLKTMLRLTAEKERLNVVFDQAGTPTYAGDLAMTIFSIVEGGYFAGNEGLYHFSNEGVASWYDFAAEIAAAAGHDKCRIRPCRTAEFPTKAARPAYSVLDKSKIKETFGLEIPHWRESMLYCLKNMLR